VVEPKPDVETGAEAPIVVPKPDWPPVVGVPVAWLLPEDSPEDATVPVPTTPPSPLVGIGVGRGLSATGIGAELPVDDEVPVAITPPSALVGIGAGRLGLSATGVGAALPEDDDVPVAITPPSPLVGMGAGRLGLSATGVGAALPDEDVVPVAITPPSALVGIGAGRLGLSETVVGAALPEEDDVPVAITPPSALVGIGTGLSLTGGELVPEATEVPVGGFKKEPGGRVPLGALVPLSVATGVGTDGAVPRTIAPSCCTVTVVVPLSTGPADTGAVGVDVGEAAVVAVESGSDP